MNEPDAENTAELAAAMRTLARDYASGSIGMQDYRAGRRKLVQAFLAAATADARRTGRAAARRAQRLRIASFLLLLLVAVALLAYTLRA